MFMKANTTWAKLIVLFLLSLDRLKALSCIISRYYCYFVLFQTLLVRMGAGKLGSIFVRVFHGPCKLCAQDLQRTSVDLFTTSI